MPGDLSTSTHLRALVEALPEGIRETAWDSDYGLVLSSRYGTGGEVVAQCIPGHLVAPGEQKETARYIARVASPPVVLALADLLDEIAKHDQADDPHDWETCFIAVRHAADALEAAIHRTPEGAA